MVCLLEKYVINLIDDIDREQFRDKYNQNQEVNRMFLTVALNKLFLHVKTAVLNREYVLNAFHILGTILKM